MSKFGLLIILILLSGKNYAQQTNYFVLIQAGNKQPFYVRLGEQSLSSSAEGSLILSQLKDSTYIITIGFPGQTSPGQSFSVDLHHRDQQFLLKDQGEKGWVLYNPLTGESRDANPREEKGSGFQPQGVRKDDAFSRLMAGVVRDTAVMYNTYAMEPAPRDSTVIAPTHANDSVAVARTVSRPDTSVGITSLPVAPPARRDTQSIDRPAMLPVVAGGKADSTLLKSTSTMPDSGTAAAKSTLPVSGSSPVSSGAVANPVSSLPGNDSSTQVTATPLRRSSVVKLSQRLLFRGLRLIYADHGTGGKVDTIEIIIPPDTLAARNRVVSDPGTAGTVSSQPPSASPVQSASGKTGHPTDTSRRAATRTNGPNPDGQIPVPVVVNPGETAKNHSDTLQKRLAAKTPLPFVNSDCHDFATDYDVDKLRVKMLESSRDDERIQAARKAFKAKCFSTRHIRALSEVFTTDALKFRFFETAYPFAADDHFRELAGTLADPVYSSKFKAMTGQ